MEPQKYIIVEANNCEDCATKVSEKLRLGYTIAGPLVTAVWQSENESFCVYYAQPLIWPLAPAPTREVK